MHLVRRMTEDIEAGEIQLHRAHVHTIIMCVLSFHYTGHFKICIFSAEMFLIEVILLETVIEMLHYKVILAVNFVIHL